MTIEVLYPLITEAIRRAEFLADLGAPGARSAYLDVSLLEEKIAEVLPPADPEGALARRGAIRAALTAMDSTRAQQLTKRFLAEVGADAKLRAELLKLLKEAEHPTATHYDTELMERYLKGETKASGIVDNWIALAASPYLKRLPTRRDDVLQDIRLEITRQLKEGKFRSQSSFKTYILGVVNRICIDQTRAQRQAKWPDPVAETEQAFFRAARGTAGPGPLLEDKDRLLVLERISPECRALWRMIIARLSYREMSIRLRLTEETILRRAQRCREKIVEKLLPEAPS